MSRKEYTPDGFFFFGKITKTHGLKGEVTVKLNVANPLDFKDINYVMMDVNGDVVPFFIEYSKISGDKMFVMFQDVKSMEQAMSFLGMAVYLPMEMLPELDDNDFYFKEIEGFTVVDENYGEVGVISSVLEYPTQAVIQVIKDGKEVLIPIHDDIIKKVDKKSKVLNVNTPEGLIEMYLSN